MVSFPPKMIGPRPPCPTSDIVPGTLKTSSGTLENAAQIVIVFLTCIISHFQCIILLLCIN